MIFTDSKFSFLPNTWKILSIVNTNEVISFTKKVPTSKYLSKGKIAVIDQSEKYIGGYINEIENIVTDDLPVIVFGDHTRVIKFIDFPFAAGADGIKVIKPLEFFNPKLYFYFLQAIKLPNKGYARHFKYLRSSSIPIPPLNEQKRIADKLDDLLARVDACKAHLERVPEILQRFRQAVLAEAVSGRLAEDFGSNQIQTLPLKKVIVRIKTGPFGSVLHKSDYICGGVPIINPMHINNGNLTPSLSMSISNKKAEELVDYRLYSGDIVIARRGVMGRCAVVKNEQEGWICGSGSMLLQTNKSVLPDYLQLFLSSPNTIRILEENSVGSTMANLNQKILMELILKVPNLEVQKGIVRRAKVMFAFVDRLQARYDAAQSKVDALAPALLVKAFRGELVPQDSNDEPAEVLLERIRQSKAEKSRTAGKSRRKS